MFFYVFIDPEIIPDATTHGEMGLGRLIDILREFNRGCLMAQTDTWEIESTLVNNIKDIPNEYHNERKLLGELVIQLYQHGPWAMLESGDATASFIQIAVAQGTKEYLDLVFTPAEISPADGDTWEACSLKNHHQSAFVIKRGCIGSGPSFRDGQISHEDLLEQCFGKLVYHSERIIITDYALGKYYNNTQPENLKRWIRWIDRRVRVPGSTTLTIRTQQPQYPRSLESDIEFLRNEVDLKLKLEYISNPPHRRTLSVESRWLSIDRGIDLARHDGMCRELGVTYSNPD